MSIWNQTDIDKLKTAIVELASGEKAQTVRFDGPPSRSITYHQVQLPEMRALLAEMVAGTSSRPRVRLAITRKGFR